MLQLDFCHDHFGEPLLDWSLRLGSEVVHFLLYQANPIGRHRVVGEVGIPLWHHGKRPISHNMSSCPVFPPKRHGVQDSPGSCEF